MDGMSAVNLRLHPCHYYTVCYNTNTMLAWFTAAIFWVLLITPSFASSRADVFRHAKAATALILSINDSAQSYTDLSRYAREALKAGGLDHPAVSMGSGFFIDGDGLLITNFHVIEDHTRLYLYVGDQFIHSDPEVLAVDADLDLAALRVTQPNIVILTLAEEMPPEGSEVIAVGYLGLPTFYKWDLRLMPQWDQALSAGRLKVGRAPQAERRDLYKRQAF